MTVAEMLGHYGRPLFSVELWPPRSEISEERLQKALSRLSAISIDFAAITYGAGGSTRRHTHDLVMRLHRDFSYTPVAHLVTAGHTLADLREILGRYAQAGIDNLLALRGDPPLDSDASLAEGELAHAIDLALLAKEEFGMCVGVAAHPEGHPRAKSFQQDMEFLAEKLRVADYAITQFFYRASNYWRLVEEMASRGVFKPIIPGVMAPTSPSTLQRMSELSGTSIPAKVQERLFRGGGDGEAFTAAGTELAIELAQELIAGGAPGIHVFTMNQASTTIAIYESLFGPGPR